MSTDIFRKKDMYDTPISQNDTTRWMGEWTYWSAPEHGVLRKEKSSFVTLQPKDFWVKVGAERRKGLLF